MINEKKTKIVATIGPASDSVEKIEELIKAGVNVFRFNTKHGDSAWHNERINRVQKIADGLKRSVGILLDLQGPEIRLETRDKQDIPISHNERIIIAESFMNEDISVVIPHPAVFEVMEPGDTLLIDDGFIEMKVLEKNKGLIVAQSLDDAVIKNRKGVNIPNKHIDMPSLIEGDLEILNVTSKNKVDFVALSFSRTRKDIEILRAEMKKRKIEAFVVAKIESQTALDHLDELIEISDAVMVARGDLGVEVPIEQLAYWQKTIIAKCREVKKPVITATQMLQSMIDNPRPTRAEATDVANAVHDGSDAVMLSAETAAGRYPVRSVKVMSDIARFNEDKFESEFMVFDVKDTTEMVASAAMTMLKNTHVLKVDAIVVFTETGYTSRVISSYRPMVPVIAITDNQRTVETLTLSYGVQAYRADFPSGEIQTPSKIIAKLKKAGILQAGSTLLVIHGKSWKTPGLTNSISIQKVE